MNPDDEIHSEMWLKSIKFGSEHCLLINYNSVEEFIEGFTYNSLICETSENVNVIIPEDL